MSGEERDTVISPEFIDPRRNPRTNYKNDGPENQLRSQPQPLSGSFDLFLSSSAALAPVVLTGLQRKADFEPPRPYVDRDENSKKKNRAREIPREKLRVSTAPAFAE